MHILKGKLSIDVDDMIDLGELGGVRIFGTTPLLGAAFEPDLPKCGTAPRGNAATLKEWRSFGGGRLSGLRFVPHNWQAFSGMLGDEAARFCSDYITKVEADAGERCVDFVEWDIETKDQVWSSDFLVGNQVRGTKGIRGNAGKSLIAADPSTHGYRWGRPGVFTMEGHQDVTTSRAVLAWINGLLVGPQCYDGAMTEAWDLNFEFLTWVEDANPVRANGAKLPASTIIPYYGASKALLPVGTVESVLFASHNVYEWIT